MRTHISPRPLALAITAMGTLALVAALATAAPARADHLPVHGIILGRGAFLAPTDIKVKTVEGDKLIVANAPTAADTIIQQVTIQPGGFTGWHTHPGPAVVVVAAGAVTYYPGDDPACTGYGFATGEAFVDPGQGHVHSARNEGSVPAVLYVTYFDVPSGVASPFVAAANPGNCTF